MTKSTATISTAHASKYLQQLCKHWSHNLDVTFDKYEGTVRFPREIRDMVFPADAIVRFTAKDDGLTCEIDASTDEQREGMKGAIARHLDRFSFREAPFAYDWNDS